MNKALSKVMDALDIETFFDCEDEEEGKHLALSLMSELGFKDVDIVFSEFRGVGVRVRIRAYIHRAGDKYGWLFEGEEVSING